jgi:hypothetical protein
MHVMAVCVGEGRFPRGWQTMHVMAAVGGGGQDEISPGLFSVVEAKSMQFILILSIHCVLLGRGSLLEKEEQRESSLVLQLRCQGEFAAREGRTPYHGSPSCPQSVRRRHR